MHPYIIDNKLNSDTPLSLLFFREGDFGDAALVAASLEFGVEEDVDEVDGGGGVDEAAGEHQAVGVVVLACQTCQVGVPAEGGTDALVFVESHADAVAGAADGYSGVAAPLFDGFGRGVSEVGIVARIGREGAEILIFYILRFEVSLDDRLEFVASVVAAESNFHISG